MTIPEAVRLLDMSRKLDPMIASEEDKVQDPEQRQRLKDSSEATAKAKRAFEDAQKGKTTNLDT